ncbi:hypothetical protein MAIT1_03245 [Magnetofaba australis IT-1]|uniref:Uncharacterized protein n=1 Tax=Magnetofaba australis IT-1 TaxID=1434232 RepID=A0A1Y2K6X3_9PROT|nr:hypothetical protein MAIT1_03245 [Magnetofaba australis IT-1]
MAFAVLIGDVAQEADDVHGHLTVGAGAHGVDGVAALGHVLEHAGTRTLMIFPLAVVLLDNGVQHFPMMLGPRFNCLILTFCHGSLYSQ